MQTITINVEDSVLDKVMYLLQNLSNIEIVENKKSNTQIKLDAVKGILSVCPLIFSVIVINCQLSSISTEV